MPSPAEITYAAGVKAATAQGIIDLIDAGTGAGKIKLYDEADVLLAEGTFTDPCGTIDGNNAVQFTFSGDIPVTTDGTCTYAIFTDSDDNVVITMPVEVSVSGVSGKLAVTGNVFLTGSILQITSASVG